MADASTIGAAFSNYEGNPALGGGSLGFGKIDTRPLDDLARYTFIYNTAEYNQRQKDAEAAAKEIADSTSYDLNTGIKKDADVLKSKYNDLINFIRDNPDAINYRNKEQWAKYKTMRNDLQDDVTAAKVRNTMYMSRQNEIQNEQEPELKAYLQGQLNNEIAGTDIRTPLKATAKFDIAPVPVGAAPTLKVQTTDIGRNVIGQADWTLPDMKLVNNAATALATGLGNLADFQNTPQFKELPTAAQELVKQRALALQASGKLEPVESAKFFNEALKQLPPDAFTTVDGQKVLNMDALKESNNSLVKGIAQQVDNYNQQMAQMRDNISKGFFKDSFGRELRFGNDASGLQQSDYKNIDLNKGITPEDLIKIKMIAQTPQPERTIKVTQTDNEIQRENIAARWAEIGVQRDKLKQANTQSVIGADSVLKEVADAINSGQDQTRRVGAGNNIKSEENVKVISDPNLLKEFATIDKDGKEVNRPSVVVYHPKSNQLTLTYYKQPEMEYVKNENGKDANGDPVTTTTLQPKAGQNIGPDGFLRNNKGQTIVDREIPLGATQWMGQIVGRKFSADDKGAVNNLVSQVYDHFNRNLGDLSAHYQGGATAPGPKQTTQTQTSSTTTKIPQGYQKYDYNGKTYYTDGTNFVDENGNPIKQ